MHVGVDAMHHHSVPRSLRNPRRVRLSLNDDDWQNEDADTVDLMGDADAALSATPNETRIDLSAYLDRVEPPTVTKTTPVSLESQEDVPFDEETQGIAHLLDYLNRVAFDDFESMAAPDPSGCDLTTSTARTATPITHDLRTPAPQRRILRDSTNHAGPSSMKAVFQDFKTGKWATPRLFKATEANHSATMSEPTLSDPVAAASGTHGIEVETVSSLEVHPDIVEDSIDLLELDASLAELLEASVDAMFSPRKTWQVSEDEWQRLEQVQRMAETALHEAVKERESARTWALKVRESVKKWVEGTAGDDRRGTFFCFR